MNPRYALIYARLIHKTLSSLIAVIFLFVGCDCTKQGKIK